MLKEKGLMQKPSKKDFIKINDWLWEIPQSFRKDMGVPARIYTSEKLLEKIEPGAIEQVINVASLPGIVKYSLAMPDIHTGYGFVIGGVAATKFPDGVISPGGIGYDQNCGCRLLLSKYQEKDIKPYLDKLATEIQKEVPSGLGRGRATKLSIKQINKILGKGVPYLVEKGYGEKEDIENCEEQGKMETADAFCVSERAKNRGRDQLGTLGSGNHFIEVQKVDEIFNEKVAEVFGLFKNQIVMMVHSGSRGLGHQNCTDYLKLAINVMAKYGIELPDKELACLPFNSPEGQKFFKAMSAACNYAWANRQMMTYYIRRVWKAVLGGNVELKLLYDVAHNIAKIEEFKEDSSSFHPFANAREHEVDEEKMKLIVHRKGATRAFPPGHPEVPEKYRQVGQPVLLPGTMGTSSFVCVGTEKSKESWYTVAHGAGRVMSRRTAMRRISGQEVVNSLKLKGIIVKCQSIRGIGDEAKASSKMLVNARIAEEAPLVYKDIDNVVEVVHNAGLANRVAKLVPLAVIKGE